MDSRLIFFKNDDAAIAVVNKLQIQKRIAMTVKSRFYSL